MNIQDKIQLLKSHSVKSIIQGASSNGTPLLKYVFEVYENQFGVTCKSCSQYIPNYIRKIQSLTKEEIMSNSVDRKYRLKAGVTIHQNGTSNYYSDHNITDKIAEKLLKENPNRSVLFSKIPTVEKPKVKAKAKSKAVKNTEK